MILSFWISGVCFWVQIPQTLQLKSIVSINSNLSLGLLPDPLDLKAKYFSSVVFLDWLDVLFLFRRFKLSSPYICLLQSDPMLVVYTKARDGAVTEVCRTEVVLNSLSPAWITKYTITYQFEVVQTLQ